MTITSDRQTQIDHAFSAGGDARLAGLPLSANPYTSYENKLYYTWRMGWLDVSLAWGREAKWPIQALPFVERAIRRRDRRLRQTVSR